MNFIEFELTGNMGWIEKAPRSVLREKEILELFQTTEEGSMAEAYAVGVAKRIIDRVREEHRQDSCFTLHATLRIVRKIHDFHIAEEAETIPLASSAVTSNS